MNSEQGNNVTSEQKTVNSLRLELPAALEHAKEDTLGFVRPFKQGLERPYPNELGIEGQAQQFSGFHR